MKTLYYLEVAKSINDNGELIPAKEMQWNTPDSMKIAYDDVELCYQEKVAKQEQLQRWVVRLRPMSWFRGLWVRLGCVLGNDNWVIVEG